MGELIALRKDGLIQTELSEEQTRNSQLNYVEAEKQKTILKSGPRRIILELTNMCNLRCRMCARSHITFRPSYMKLNVLQKIKPFLEKAEEVTLMGWGEPSVHPEFSEFINQLDKYKNLRKYLLTNGTSLACLKKFIKDGKLDIMAISLDGATAKMNDDIRQGSDFEYIIENLKKIIELKGSIKKFPYMNFVFVLMKRNIHELPDYVRLAKEIGIPEVKTVYLTSFFKEMDDETMWNNRDYYEKHIKEAMRIAHEAGIAFRSSPLIGEDPTGDKLHGQCKLAWRDFFIGSDNWIRPCHTTSQKLININDFYTIEEIWNCEEFQRFRKGVNGTKETMSVQCAHCYQASHANWNKKYAHIQTGLNYCMDWEIKVD